MKFLLTNYFLKFNIAVQNLLYLFLISVVINFISNNISNFARENNLQKLQTSAQEFNKNLGEMKIIQNFVNKLCELTGLIYPESKESSFNVKLPSFYLDIIMAREGDNLKIKEILLKPNYSDRRFARSVEIEKK